MSNPAAPRQMPMVEMGMPQAVEELVDEAVVVSSRVDREAKGVEVPLDSVVVEVLPVAAVEPARLPTHDSSWHLPQS